MPYKGAPDDMTFVNDNDDARLAWLAQLKVVIVTPPFHSPPAAMPVKKAMKSACAGAAPARKAMKKPAAAPARAMKAMKAMKERPKDCFYFLCCRFDFPAQFGFKLSDPRQPPTHQGHRNRNTDYKPYCFVPVVGLGWVASLVRFGFCLVRLGSVSVLVSVWCRFASVWFQFGLVSVRFWFWFYNGEEKKYEEAPEEQGEEEADEI